MAMGTSGWRVLTPAELASEPGARLGGALAMICCAAIVIAPLAALQVVLYLSPVGLALLSGAGTSKLAAASLHVELVHKLLLMVWAIVHLVVTSLRARSGPVISAALFATCLLFEPLGKLGIIASYSPPPFLLGWATLLLPLLVNSVAVVAFWAYMHHGRRPNLYFRRRVWT